MKKLLLILLVCVAASIKAQPRPATGGWFTLNLPVTVSDHWQWHNDASYRTLGTSFLPMQYLYRTGLRYNFNKQWSTAGGIAIFFTKTDFDKLHHEFGNEFRFWQEGLFQPALTKNLKLLLRIRTEQRFFAETSRKERFTAHRFRFRPGITQKLNERWSLQLTEEYMRQAANQQFSFDQNRVIFTGAYHFNKSAQLQAGYMLLKWPGKSQHILSVSFTKNIALHGS